MLQKNRENKITGIFHEETFEVSSLIISLSMFYPSAKKGRKGANKGHRKKYYESVLFYMCVSITSSLTVLVLRFPQGCGEGRAG